MKTRWEILTVDDEEVMCESLAAWLREDGYAVDTASSGREAIEKSAAKDYAIYFIDLKMPGGMDGIETMMEIRRMHADASIIIITAYATVDTDHRDEGRRAGVYRQAVQPGRDFAAGGAHHQGEESTA